MRADKLGDALVSAGFSREEMELGAAVTKFLKSGGSRASAHAVVDAAAERMPGKGQTTNVALSDRPHIAPTRQPVEDGVANDLVPDKGLPAFAIPSSFPPDRESHNRGANLGHLPAALPVREPKPQRAAIDFGVHSLAIKTKLANSVMDRIKIDGMAIGDYSPKRAQIEGAKKTREGYILREAARIALNVANPPSGATIRDLVKASEMESIEQAAKVLNDVA